MYDENDWDSQEYFEPEQPAPLDPRVENMLNTIEREAAHQSYDAEMQRMAEQHPGLDPELMHVHVAAADGDFDAAYQMYEHQVNHWNSRVAAPVEEAPAEPVAPRSLNEAIDNWITTERGRR